MDRWALIANEVSPPIGHYSQARSVAVPGGTWVLLAGQVATDSEGGLVGGSDPAAQARQVYANIATILGNGGGTFADILRLTTFATADVPLAAAVAAREPYLTGTGPATTFTYVSGLADARFLLEVEATAFVPDARP
jgi:enamine deaminase RidA (YjgF/YER057c/UK114 family)